MRRAFGKPVRRALSGCVLSLTICAALPAAAQSLRDNPQPAELPPASFQGNQYVDSTGCVFIRAGVDGATRWVPRVARNRELICGFQPSLAEGTTPLPEGGQPAEDVVQIVPDATPPSVPETDGSPQQAATATAESTPAPVATPPVAAPDPVLPAARTVLVVPARPTPEAVSGPDPAPTSEPVAVFGDPMQRQIRSNGGIRIILPRRVEVYAGASGTTRVTDQTRIAPKTAHEERAGARPVPPPGYRAAFDDGRFNPQRAHQTLAGRREMLLVWTSTVPRQLIDQRTGQNVTAHFPGVRYPDMPSQTTGATRVVVSETPLHVSSRSAPTGHSDKAATHRFVQVGVFRPDGAQIAIDRLHGAGLPLRIRPFKHKGEEVRMVLAGPFKEQSALDSALATSQRLGFPGAKLRK